MQTKSELTPAQAKTLAFIRSYIAKNGYSPTFSEIAIAEKVNVNAIGERIAQMVKKGAVTKADALVAFGPSRRHNNQHQMLCRRNPCPRPRHEMKVSPIVARRLGPAYQREELRTVRDD